MGIWWWRILLICLFVKSDEFRSPGEESRPRKKKRKSKSTRGAKMGGYRGFLGNLASVDVHICTAPT